MICPLETFCVRHGIVKHPTRKLLHRWSVPTTLGSGTVLLRFASPQVRVGALVKPYLFVMGFFPYDQLVVCTCLSRGGRFQSNSTFHKPRATSWGG